MNKHAPDPEWRLKAADPATVEAVAEKFGLHRATARILVSRGLVDPSQVAEFLNPSLSGMADPFLMSGISDAVTRLLKARQSKERVCIYGDYDVDGVSATALLVSGLSGLGFDVAYQIPHRMDEGYGLNADSLKAIRAAGSSLCISVDCGITALEEALLCRDIGLDLIITDHHQPLATIPDAFAVINPHQPGCLYPFKGLAGVGVAFNLLVALRARLRADRCLDGSGPDLRELLDMVALGTVADMVPLAGQNRLLVAAGLHRMGEGCRRGLQALKRVSGINGAVSSTEVAFRLAPRLNAAGRLESAIPGVELLLSDDMAEAERLARNLDDANTERQGVERRILEEASSMVELAGGLDGRHSIVLASVDWHPGVVGIVASRMVERYHRPAILIALNSDGTGKGSGRGIPGFHLLDALHECSSWLDRYGGHMAAAGVSIREGAVTEFAAGFEKVASARLGSVSLIPEIRLDVELEPDELTVSLANEIRLLAPFGVGNPEPVALVSGLRVMDRRVIGKDHVRLRLARGRHYINAIGWRMAEMDIPETIDVAGIPEIDTWGGGARLQLRIKAFRKG